MAAQGYTGVYIPEVIAEGEGPEDFSVYLQQQFAWAYSMIQIFLTRMPRLVLRYKGRQAIQFLFSQSWYPMWAASIACLWLLPVVALLTDQTIANVPLSEFLAYHLAVLGASTLLWWWSREWFQPRGLLISWRAVILELARWPVVLWAFVNVVFRIRRPYMI